MGDLKTFKSRLENFSKNRTELADKFANKIADRGVQIANEQYSGVSGVSISKLTSTQGKASIISTGEKVSFMEFGTGIMGKGTYVSWKLPKENITFESPKGQPQMTKGWQYDYRKEQGQTEHSHTGFAAQAQMFRTAQQLKQEMSQIVAKEIKGESVNV